MYKCINKLDPDYLADKFVQRSHIHNRNTRSRNQLDIPRCRKQKLDKLSRYLEVGC